MSEDKGTYQRLLTNRQWKGFSNKVKTRDGFRCTVCKRSGEEVPLQANHLTYKPDLKPWEYPISDLVTICNDCHALEHGIIPKKQPQRGWELIEIIDLGNMVGTCQNEGCGASIRYEQHAYHPLWGRMITGSTCIEHLTLEDQKFIFRTISLSLKIKRQLDCNPIFTAETARGYPYFYASCRFGDVRVYGHENQKYAVQIRQKGQKALTEPKRVKATNLDQALESAYVWLMGVCAKKESDRDLYRSMWAAKEA